ncbi:MAG: OmpA family protein [Azospirillum sp.]|nr:OmpA family protein [Azospirillum sp.]
MPAAAADRNRLLAAAMPLLGRLARLTNRTPAMAADAVRHSVIAALDGFRTAAEAAGLAPATLAAGHFALCATADDRLFRTRWGAAGGWPRPGLIDTFHSDGSEAAAALVDTWASGRSDDLDGMELMMVCLALGWHGGDGENAPGWRREQIRQRLAGRRGLPEALTLSPPAARLHDSQSARSLPVWTTGAVAAMLLAVLFAGFSLALGQASDALTARLARVAAGPAVAVAGPELPRAIVPVSTRPPPAALDRTTAAAAPRIDLAAELRRSIGSDTVAVAESDHGLTIRFDARSLFVDGGDRLAPAILPVLERTATLIGTATGPIQVVGHADRRAARKSHFHTVQALGQARAEAVRRLLAAHLGAGDPDRLKAVGLATASHAGAPGIEIILGKDPSDGR